MSEVKTELTEALQWVHEDWSEERIRRGRVALERASARQRRARRAGVASAAALAMAATVVAFAWPRSSGELAFSGFSPIGVSTTASSEDTPGALRFQDGSVAIPLGTDTAMATSRDEREHAELELLGGAARFDVVPRPSRAFEVQVGSVRVSVLGTRFDVRRQPRHVLVHVLRGRVRVQWLGGERVLTATQSGLFPLELPGGAGAEVEGASDAGTQPETTETTTADEFDLDFTLDPPDEFLEGSREEEGEPGADGEARGGPRRAAGDWRTLARAGRYDDAYEAARGVTVGDSMSELLLAADTARLTRHLPEAVGHLERALGLHPSDRRAHLAAFTLGRVLLQNGQPDRAARAFARAQQLDSTGVLREAALAREVQALARAGNRDAARRRARTYLAQYPSGRHANSVRAYADGP
ncbi:MAG: FecR domain-containing protein [Myxococcales bacterium]|nr:FecR domain-containing protein [Myxococcales bacterium]MCB9629933.1 FecR domain-containing protein [Sandaracinaceae bacterium]